MARADPVVVMVGGYDFPPFVERDANDQPVGIALDMIDLLNQSQDAYRFDFFLTSPSRRYQDFTKGRFDLMLFESPNWGWLDDGFPVEASEVFLTGGEVYIARVEPGRDQSFFADLSQRRVAGILGYHYGFADFKSDPEALRDRGVILVNSHDAAIELVTRGRVDVAVVTIAYLRRYLSDHPDLVDQLMVSDALDQVYEHRILSRTGSQPTMADLNALLQDLQESGALDALWMKTGIRP